MRSYEIFIFIFMFLITTMTIIFVGKNCPPGDNVQVSAFNVEYSTAVLNMPEYSTNCNLTIDLLSDACIFKSTQALQKMAKLVKWLDKQPVVHRYSLKIRMFGNDRILEYNRKKPCIFYAVGTIHDTFESQLADAFDCRLYVIDYTKPSPIIGNSMSPVDLRLKKQHIKVNILKIDCLECEFSIVPDMVRADVSFLDHVDQLILTVHIGTRILTSTKQLNSLGLLYHMLFESGFELMHSQMIDCSHGDLTDVCPTQLLTIDYPCQILCQKYLFARLPHSHR